MAGAALLPGFDPVRQKKHLIKGMTAGSAAVMELTSCQRSNYLIKSSALQAHSANSNHIYVGVAELVDALDSGSSGLAPIGVQFPSSTPTDQKQATPVY
jgi:hypothetical protein